MRFFSSKLFSKIHRFAYSYIDKVGTIIDCFYQDGITTVVFKDAIYTTSNFINWNVTIPSHGNISTCTKCDYGRFAVCTNEGYFVLYKNYVQNKQIVTDVESYVEVVSVNFPDNGQYMFDHILCFENGNTTSCVIIVNTFNENTGTYNLPYYAYIPNVYQPVSTYTRLKYGSTNFSQFVVGLQKTENLDGGDYLVLAGKDQTILSAKINSSISWTRKLVINNNHDIRHIFHYYDDVFALIRPVTTSSNENMFISGYTFSDNVVEDTIPALPTGFNPNKSFCYDNILYLYSSGTDLVYSLNDLYSVEPSNGGVVMHALGSYDGFFKISIPDNVSVNAITRTNDKFLIVGSDGTTPKTLILSTAYLEEEENV